MHFIAVAFPFLTPVISKLMPFVPLNVERFFYKLSNDVIKQRVDQANEPQSSRVNTHVADTEGTVEFLHIFIGLFSAQKVMDFVQLMATSLVPEPTPQDLSRDNIHEDRVGLLWNDQGGWKLLR